MKKFNSETMRYLELLATQYPTIQRASSEIINLQAILSLPKGTEHFLSDIHGEYESFIHILNNASGVIKRKIDEIFVNVMRENERRTLATLIYYPEDKLKLIMKLESNLEEWYRITLHRLIHVCRLLSSKYTRSKVRKALPKDFAYIIEELLHEQELGINKEEYYNGIIDTIIRINRANNFVIAICKLIRRLAIDRLHIVGDIFDRGPRPDLVMDALIDHHSVDIQWGNHDVVWMGAALGIKAYIATVLRIATRYDNIDVIEESYGINIRPLVTFAMEYYKNDPCDKFTPKIDEDRDPGEKEITLIKQMHKAIAILQFKLEGEIILRNPRFEMHDRLLLDKINYEKGTIIIDNVEYELNDKSFPTVDPKNPYALTPEEEEVMKRLRSSFVNSEKLQKHIKFMFDKGGMYLTFNSNLMYHGCIPLNEDGTFTVLNIEGQDYGGRDLVVKLEELAQKCFLQQHIGTCCQVALDYFWYLWCGPNSPLFGKKKMTTFERYFIDDKETHKEDKNPYFTFRDHEKVCDMILENFGLNPNDAHIVNGHVPVKMKKGESPVKANGKLLVIDGGLSKAYQKVTGNAGYTLIYNSYGLLLATHKPFDSRKKAIMEEKDIYTTLSILEKQPVRKRVGDTDIGKSLRQQIQDLEMLLEAYREGIIKENLL